MRESIFTEQFIHCKTHSYGAGIANGFLCLFDQFSEKTNTVFKRASIFIRAVVIAFQNKLDRRRHPMTRITRDNVKACTLVAQRGVSVPLAYIADILLVHAAGLYGVIARATDCSH